MRNKKFNIRQKRIRDIEWSAFEDEIRSLNGRFLDVGAGTGYDMYKAESLGFQVYGIEPYINEYGVFDERLKKFLEKIRQGNAESIPFQDNFFKIVYASHTIEHFQNMAKGLSEMSRVLDKNGIAIIVVPTGLMSFINLVSQYVFTSHRRIGRFIFKEMNWENFRNIFIPNSHGSQNTTLLGEIFSFRIKIWKKLISTFFTVDRTILPCLYPFPDFPQFFPYIKNNRFSSSAIFICSTKGNEKGSK